MASASRTFEGTIHETTPGATASRDLKLTLNAQEAEGAPSTKPVPSLVWINATTDVRPRFDAWVHDAADGDVLTIQIADSEVFSSPVEYETPISSAEYAAHSASISFEPLANGTWHARVRANDGPWSATQPHIIDADTTAPVLSSPTGVGLTYSTAMVGATTDEGSGTLYYIITTSAKQPSIAELIAGGHIGGSQVVSTTGVQEIEVAGISDPGGTIYAHLVQVDAAGNPSNRVTSAGFTIPAASGAAFHPTAPVTGIYTLSNSDKTVTTQTHGCVARSLIPYSGKKLVAFKIDSQPIANGACVYPVTNASGVGDYPTWTDPDPAKRACYCWAGGAISAGAGAVDVKAPTYALGDRLGVLVDAELKVFWVTKDGSAFYGSAGTPLTKAQVEAGTGGLSYSVTAANGLVYVGAGSSGAYGAAGAVVTMLDKWPWTDVSGYSYLE